MAESAVIRIDGIAAGGAGVGRLDGMAVFVPRTAPGDEAEVVLRRRRRYADGRLRRLVSPGPTRTEPPCQHYVPDRCGGCQLQHLTYDAQLTAKRDIVVQAFRRIGRRAVAIDAVLAAPDPWRYRNKLTLTLRRRGGQWRAGLRPYDAPDEIFSLRDCPITSEQVMTGWREVMAASEHLPDAMDLRGAVRLLGPGCALLLSGGRDWPAAPQFAAQCPSLASIHWEDELGRMVSIRGPASGDAGVTSFEQVNLALAGTLHDHVAALVSRAAPTRVIDAYAGRGETALRLVKPARELVLIELDANATRRAAAALGDRARVVTARVEDQLPHELPADAVVLNPPRIGVDEAVCRALETASRKPSTIVYVSCDPATLARDVARLPSYRVASVTLFDMFPQTAHVETVCELTPEAA